MTVRAALLALMAAGLLLPEPVLPQDPARAPVQSVPEGILFDFLDAELRFVLAAVAEAGGLNVSFAELPSRAVTLRTNSPIARESVRQVLESLATGNGLRIIEEGPLLRIEPLGPVGSGEAQEEPASQGEERLWVYRLRHAKAADLSGTIQSIFGGSVSSSPVSEPAFPTRQRPLSIAPFDPGPPPTEQHGTETAPLRAQLQGPTSIVPDPQTNSILVRGTEADWETVQAAIQALDIRPLQVLIEVLIAEVRRTKLDDVGVSLTVPDSRESRTGTVIGGKVETAGTGDFSLRIREIGGVNADVLISALSAKSDVTILSRPVVFVQNNQLARILVGSERPFIQVLRALPTDNAVRDQVIQYRDVGTSLTIRPTINPDGYVSLEMLQEVSTATNETQFGAPVISTRQAETQLMVRDGHTVVIGGLIDQERERVRSGVPLLKDIPVFGGLFGSTRSGRLSTELFIFITPHVVATDEDAEDVREAVEGGTEHLRGRLPEPRTLVPPPPETPTPPPPPPPSGSHL